MSVKKPHILYVDDEKMNLLVFEISFRKNFKISTAISGEKALEIFNTEEIDIIITDQRMPGMTGTELLRKIQEINTKIPPGRLILSGCSFSEIEDQVEEEMNLYKFISKPFNVESLRNDLLMSMNSENY